MRAQRHPHTPMISKVRSMVQADVEMLRQKSTVPAIKRLRESHHRICYFLSTGMTYADIARHTGYSISRISVLANTPAVQEQVAVYRREALSPLLLKDREELKEAIGLQQLRMIKDHMDDADAEGEILPLRDLYTGYKAIHGNSGTTINVNVGFAARLERAVAITRQLEHDPDA